MTSTACLCFTAAWTGKGETHLYLLNIGIYWCHTLTESKVRKPEVLVTAEAGQAERRWPSGVQEPSGNPTHPGANELSVSLSLLPRDVYWCGGRTTSLGRDEINSVDTWTLERNSLWKDKLMQEKGCSHERELQKKGCALWWDNLWPCLVGPVSGWPASSLFATCSMLPSCGWTPASAAGRCCSAYGWTVFID